MLPLTRRRRSPDRLVGGRYLLGEHLGSGGMGSVWRAVDRRTGDEVALKVLGQHDPGSATLLRFVREQAVRVRHPHVLAPVGWVAEDDRVALATRLVRGGTVEDLLAEHGPLPTTYAAALLDQLLDALAAVHRAGVVHRDVKPANLLLEPTGTGRPRLLLADFGVAVVSGDSRLPRVPGPVGTDGFLPPELLEARVEDDRDFICTQSGLHLLWTRAATVSPWQEGLRPAGRRRRCPPRRPSVTCGEGQGRLPAARGTLPTRAHA